MRPHLAHASMEPPVAVAEYRDGKVARLGSDPESASRAGDRRSRSWALRRKT